MATAASDSRSQTARQRARKAMSSELEKARQRETQLAAVFTAIDGLDDARTTLGSALTQLRELGIAQGDLAQMTGLSSREVTAALRSATDKTKVEMNTTDTTAGGSDHNDDTEASPSAPADHDSDTN